jgi:hypothetical protein
MLPHAGDGQRSRYNVKHRNRTLVYELFTNTNYLNSTLISWSLLMSLDVINEWDIGRLAGPRLELPRSKYQNFRGASAIIYCQHMPKTALFCLVSIVAQPMLPFSKISWNNFFGIVGGSQHQNLCLLWIMLPFITLRGLSSCTPMQELYFCTCHPTHRISTLLRILCRAERLYQKGLAIIRAEPQTKLSCLPPGMCLRCWRKTRECRRPFQTCGHRDPGV